MITAFNLRVKFLCILLATASLSAFAQDKKIRIAYKKDNPADFYNLSDAGLLLENAGTLQLYSIAGDKLWEHPFPEKEWNDQEMFDRFVTTPSLSYSYRVQGKDTKVKKFTGKASKITQFSKTGTVKEIEMPLRDGMGESLQTILCDERYLYFITTEMGNEQDDKKKATEKMILNRFTHDNQTYSKIVLALPALKPDDFNSKYWQYTGYIGELHYVISKAMAGEGKDGNIIELIGFTADGEIRLKKTLTIELKDKFTRPASMSSDNNNTFRNLQMFDRWFSGQGYGQDVGAFMGFTADADQECFYAYGLLGPALFKRVAPEYEGFYVVKYDKEGNELWRTLYPGDAELKEDRIFTRGAAPLQRYVRFSVLPEGKLEVSMWWHKNNVNYRISAADGKVKKVDAVSQESAAEKFIANRPKIDGEYRGAYETNTTSIAMITNEKEKTVDLYFFLKK